MATVIANAAVVPTGTAGSVDVYATQNTDLVIDINGYYVQQTTMSLAQGTAAAPSVSFSGDPGTGIFSSGAGTLNIATAGTSRLSVASNGDLNLAGNFNATGNVHISSASTAGTSFVLENTTSSVPLMYLSNYGSIGAGPYWSGLDSANTSSLLGTNLFVLRANNGLAFSGSSTAEHMRITPGGSVGIGTNSPSGARLDVEAGADFGVGDGVFGTAVNGVGVHGNSVNGVGVFGTSTSSYAGYFDSDIYVTGSVHYGVLSQNSDARLKQGVANLGYGLPEVMQLRPVTYTWKEKPEQGVQLGLVGQEVERVVPELVTTAKDEQQTKGINYIGLVPVTIKAIQEQQAQIEGQQKTIEQQQIQIDQLKQLLCYEHAQAEVCK
jgi:hypothetical protein